MAVPVVNIVIETDTDFSRTFNLKKSDNTPLNLIISGGGQNNNYLTGRLKEIFNFSVKTANEIDLPGDYLESELNNSESYFHRHKN